MPHAVSDPIERFPDGAVCDAGVPVDEVAPGTTLEVTTSNTCYRLTVLDTGGRAVIEGGTRFQEPTEVCIVGSSAGRRVLRIGWIGVGLRLGMTVGSRMIITSPIRSLRPAHP